MAYQYPLNGGRINASVGGNSTSAGAGYQLVSTGTLMLAGGNNVTLQQNANSISISGLSYADSNGVSFGINAGTLTASVNAAQSVQTIGGYATGNTTGQSSSSTFDARSLSVSAIGGASAGYSGGMLQVAAPAVSSLSQTGIISLSQNGNTISIGAPAFSAGMSTDGNSAGTAGTVSNQLVFVGGNNVTLSQSTGAGGNTLSIAGPSLSNSNGFTFGTNGSVVTASYAGGGSVNFSANGVSTNLASVGFLNSNGISFGIGGSVITASHNAITTQTAQTANLYGSGNTTQSSSYAGVDLRSITFQGDGNASVGLSSGKILISATQSAQTQNRFNLTLTGNTAGVMAQVSSGTLSLAGGNNITLSQAGNVVTISGAAQSVQSIGGYATGNTTQNSSTTFDARSLTFNGLGGVSVGYSNGSVQISGATGGGGGGVALSAAGGSISSGTASVAAGGALTASVNGQTLSLNAPATSMLSALGGVTISTTGSTIAFSAGGDASVQTLNYYQNMDRGTTATLAVPLANSLMLQRLNQENDLFAGNITANTVLLNMTANLNSTATTAHTVSAYIGIYTDNATNLSLLNSASTSWGLAGGNNTSVYNGPRWLSFVASQWSSAPVFTQGGDYVFGILMKSSSFAPPLSYFGQNYMLSNQRSGYIGASIATNTSMAQGNFWNAVMATASLPSSINSTQANRNNASAIFMPHIILNNRYSSL